MVLSGYPSTLYDRRLYPDWHRLEIPTTAHSGQARQRRRSRGVEVIWSNRPLRSQQALNLNDPAPMNLAQGRTRG